MAITTEKNVKTILKIVDTNSDALIKLLIPMVEQQILTYTKNTFLVDDAVVFPADVELAAIKLINYHMNHNDNVAAESAGNSSTTFITDIPCDIKAMLNPYRKLKLGW